MGIAAVEKLSICEGTWGDRPATIASLNLVSGKMVCSTKEYTLAYIPELNKWRGDVIAYGEWVDVAEEEIDDLRTAYYLDALVSLN